MNFECSQLIKGGSRVTIIYCLVSANIKISGTKIGDKIQSRVNVNNFPVPRRNIQGDRPEGGIVDLVRRGYVKGKGVRRRCLVL